MLLPDYRKCCKFAFYMRDVSIRLMAVICMICSAVMVVESHAQAQLYADGPSDPPCGNEMPAERDSLVAAFLGDSNLWIGGDDCSQQRAWSYWFCHLMKPAKARSYARSGATWTHTANTKIDTAFYSEVLAPDNVVRPQAERLIADVLADRFPIPSVIFIAAGTNDAWFAEHRPGLWDRDNTTPTTLTGSITASVTRLREAFPAARIILLTPPPAAATTPQRISRVSSIICDTSQALEVETVRLDTLSQIDPKTEKQKPRYTSDGTHTSKAGAILIANIVIQTLFR